MSFTSNVSSGSVITGEMVAGGEQYVSAGGITSNTTVRNSGRQYVASGGMAIVTNVNSGGSQYVDGTAAYTTINSSGSQFVDGKATYTTINFNGSQYVDGTATSTTINSGGSQQVDFYGTAVSTIINSGGLQTVSYNGLTSKTVINDNGSQYVSSGGTATSTFISSGGIQEVFSSGLTFYTVISSGGEQFVSSGGVTSMTRISSGGDQKVAGMAVGATVSSGGAQFVAGGTATTTVISSGGGQFVSSGGFASKSTVKSGGLLMVGSGCSATGFTISSGGILGWDFNAVLSGTSKSASSSVIISSSTGNYSYNLYIYGGYQYVSAGQTADSTVINSGGSQYILRGGTANNCTVQNTGLQYVSSGGTANDTIINSGGLQDIAYRGTANDTAINSGGSQHVSSGGAVNNIFIGAGGDMAVDNGGLLGGTLTVDGGHVDLGNTDSLSKVTEVTYMLADTSANDSLITIDTGTLGSELTAYSLNLNNASAGSYLLLEATDLSGMAGKTFTLNCADISASLLVGSTYTFTNGNSVSLSIADSAIDHLVAEVSGDFIAPSVPTDLTQKATGAIAALDWSDAADNYSGIKQYNIEYSTDSLFTVATAATSNASALTLDLTGLTTLTTFYWRVQAEDNYGNLSGWSSSSSFIATPTDLAANDYKAAKDISILDNWVGLDDPADCYKITLSNAAKLTLNLTGLSSDVNLSLLDSNGKVLKSSANKGAADEAIANQLLVSGTYYVKVAPAKGVNNASYVLGKTQEDFPTETAGNTLATAGAIPVDGSVNEWVGFADPADYYKLTLDKNGALTLNLTGLSSDASLTLLDNKGKVLKSSTNKGAAAESITSPALLAGEYYVKISPADGGKTAVDNTYYTLGNTVSYFPVETAGNTLATAGAIPVDGSVSEWVGFADAADYYKLTLDKNGALTLNLTGLSSDASLTLLDNKGKVLKSSTNKGSAAESITSPALLAGEYYVKISPADGGKTAVDNTYYTLGNTVSYFPVETAGNTLATAGAIPVNGSVNEWVGFADPADYYKLTLDKNGALTLNLTGLSSDANLTLLDSAGKVLKTSASKSSAAESIASLNLLAGEYYVKISPADGGKTAVNNTNYTLTDTVEYFPVNTAGNSFANAVALTSNGTTHEWLGFGDKEDYYKFEVSADGSAVTGGLSGFDSNINLYVYDSTHKLVASSAKSGLATESIDSGAGKVDAGTYYIKVVLAGTAATYYDLNFNLTQPGSLLTGSADAALTGDPLTKTTGILAS
ncbi:MAG: pre-peptidase C-terminal domain-containing protein [Victivallaceae bacterium]|jgi:autotransporter passenger strand-loop-strand repeat protein